MLLTDDGALAHDILSPAHHVEKQYVVTLDTPLTDAMRRGFAAGVTLTDGETMAPAGVEPLTDEALRPCAGLAGLAARLKGDGGDDQGGDRG